MTSEPARRALRAALVLALAVPASAQTFSTTVAMSDGVGLATDVYLPLGVSPRAAVLQRTPYGRAQLRSVCLTFTLMGYACVAQDVRGRGGSGGAITAFVDDGGDGREVVAWIAEQVWSDGRVATFGPSALGITQYLMAPSAPNALRCQVPLVATPDLYHHAVYQGGALRTSLTTGWLGDDGKDVLDQLLVHRLRDSFWSKSDVLPRAGEIAIPALHIGGWYDIFSQGTLDAFTVLQHRGGDGAREAQKLIVGPWTHLGTGGRTAGELTYPANAAIYGDLLGLLRDWLRSCLEGRASDADAWPAVRVYLMGAVGEAGAPGNLWVDLEDWPPPARPALLYLAEGGQLLPGPPTRGGVELASDPGDPVPTLGGANLYPDLEVEGRPMGAGPHDQRPVEARDDVVTFTSAALERPLAVMGRVRLHALIIPDTLDLDLAVRLSDVYPDGRSMLVTDGIQRARMRCGDDRECLLVPGVPTDVTVDLWSTAIVFAAGHRIRVSLSGSNSPRFEVNPNDGAALDAPTMGIVARPTLVLGDVDGSRLELPVPVRDPRRRLERGSSGAPAGDAGASRSTE